MSEIDWSGAPKWATVRLAHVNGNIFAWAEGYENRARAKHECGLEFELFHTLWRVIAERPVPTWDGKGLPPVGTVCEIKNNSEWKKCEIVAHKDIDGVTHAIAWIDADTCDQSQGIRFRPIPTPEQIAAEKRKNAIEEMVEIARKVSRWGSSPIEMAAIYDAGYRKQEAP